MKRITDAVKKPAQPVRILQSGEGIFLRAFVDWMIEKMHDEIHFHICVKPKGSLALIFPPPLLHENS
jgi:mannitol-1-phosphate/altronate dehydrogenase